MRIIILSVLSIVLIGGVASSCGRTTSPEPTPPSQTYQRPGSPVSTPSAKAIESIPSLPTTLPSSAGPFEALSPQPETQNQPESLPRNPETESAPATW